MPKRCFVISPIGEAGSVVREHSDDVLDFIIKPAMDELGIVAYRADHSQQIGRITDQMFSSILTDDLCIAVLTFHNPNVFYELAIAQSAARPVIILIEKGQTIPFDIRDLRAIEYDLKPRPLRDRVYSKQIIDHVRNLEACNWQVQVPFGSHLSPLGGKPELFKLYNKVEDFGNTERWLDLLRNAKETFDLSGVSLRWWLKINAFRPTMLEKARQGCKIRLLIMDAENPALGQYVNNSVGQRHHQLPNDIGGALAFFEELAEECPNIEFRQIRTGCLHQQQSRNDHMMLSALVLYGDGTSRSPLLESRAASPMYRAMLAEFEALWNANAPRE